MTGAEHYARAEEILQNLSNRTPSATDQLARAQVHATLALTQATLVAMDSADWEKA